MGDVFKALSSGLARFVLAWIAPSVLSLGLFSLFVLPQIDDSWLLTPVTSPAKDSGVTAALIFAFFVMLFSVLFAYLSTPIYRILEGYSLPNWIRRRLLRRQLRLWYRIRAIEHRYRQTGAVTSNLHFELIDSYPQEREEVQATRLGNALRAMETFGVTRYGLDSQRLWYELQGVASDATRRDTEEGRAPVDFFVSSIAHMTTLGLVAITVAATSRDLRPAVVGMLALATTPLAYRMALHNMLDWSGATKALVNLGRLDLAERLGLRMPATLAEEAGMWDAYIDVIEMNNRSRKQKYDAYRNPAPASASRDRLAERAADAPGSTAVADSGSDGAADVGSPA